jgi:hypothetical protein
VPTRRSAAISTNRHTAGCCCGPADRMRFMKLGVHEGRIQSCRPVGSSHPVMIVGHWHSPAHTETSGNRPESQPVRRGSRLTCIRPAVCNYRLQPTSASRSPELPTALPLLGPGLRPRFKPAGESSQQAQHRWQLRGACPARHRAAIPSH